jgi:hypothetical protein
VSTRNAERRGHGGIVVVVIGAAFLGFEHSTSCWETAGGIASHHIKHNKTRIHATYSSFVE